MGLDTKAVAALSNPSFEVFQASDILQSLRGIVKLQNLSLADVLFFLFQNEINIPFADLALGSQGAGQNPLDTLSGKSLAGSDQLFKSKAAHLQLIGRDDTGDNSFNFRNAGQRKVTDHHFFPQV